MSAVLAFPPLMPTDSLVRRIEDIWGMKPSVIEVSIGYLHPHDDSRCDFVRIQMNRQEAAAQLRMARKQGLFIDRTPTGYCMSGALNPAWRYDA